MRLDERGSLPLMLGFAVAGFMSIVLLQIQESQLLLVKELKDFDLNAEIENYVSTLSTELSKECRATLRNEDINGPVSAAGISRIDALVPLPEGVTATYAISSFVPNNGSVDANFLNTKLTITFTKNAQQTLGASQLVRNISVMGFRTGLATILNDCVEHGTAEALAGYWSAPCASSGDAKANCSLDDATQAMLYHICRINDPTMGTTECNNICPDGTPVLGPLQGSDPEICDDVGIAPGGAAT